MADHKQDLSTEGRLSRVEQALEDHVKVCERNSNEAKWWLRSLGLGAILFGCKVFWTWAATGHLPS